MHPLGRRRSRPTPRYAPAGGRKKQHGGALIGGRLPAGPGSGGNRWVALDLLTTLAVVLCLFAVTGYANASPLGAEEESLDAFYEEVWDHADDATIAAGQTSMIEMVRAAREDARIYAASTPHPGGSAAVPASTTAAMDATTTVTPTLPVLPAGWGATSPMYAAPILIPSGQLAPGTATPRPTPTSTLEPTPTSTPRRVIISTGPLPGDRRRSEPDAPVPTPTQPVFRPPDTPVPPAPTATPSNDNRATDPTITPTLAIPTSVPVAPTRGVPPAATPTPHVTTTPTPHGTTVPTPDPTHTPTPDPTSAPTSTSTPTPITGSVVIRTDAPATGLLRMNTMRPGACLTQNVTVVNAGRLAFSTYTLSTAAADGPTMLWTDSVDGLQLRVRRAGTVLYDGPVAVSNLDLGAGLQLGERDSLELRVCLPAAAGNAAQGQSQAVTITWTATGG
jgi:hypothetical protein